jgi:hypothetical protein
LLKIEKERLREEIGDLLSTTLYKTKTMLEGEGEGEEEEEGGGRGSKTRRINNNHPGHK